ncbi:MAG: hypothetical protein Q7T86_01695 [Hyphomicrobiaceae bacterium]|nr:hypothetical protein [Hyphomicrobiaceae bacterium]
MNILKGTFRLSLLVGLAALGYFVWDALETANASAQKDVEMWSTLRCGERLLSVDTKPYENDYGLIDLGKAGCSGRQFLAHRHEIQAAIKQDSPFLATLRKERDWRLPIAYGDAVAAFVLVNLLGLCYLAARWAVRWVSSGYRPG